MSTITVRVDEDSLVWLAEFRERLSVLSDLVPRPVDILQCIRGIPESGRFNVKRLATVRANEVRIGFEPCEALLELMSALRAWDRHGHFVGKASHIETPVSGDDDSATG